MLKKIAQNSSYLVVSATIVKVAFFLWSAFIARLLGIELFGQFNYLVSFTILFTSLPDLGIGLILTRQLSRDLQANTKQWFQYQTINHGLSLTTIPLIVALFFIYSGTTQLITPIILAAILFALSATRSPYVVLLQSVQRFKHLSVCELINVIAPIIFSLIAVLINPSVSSLLLGQIIGMSVSLLVVYLFTKNVIPVSRPTFNPGTIKRLIRLSLPLGMAAFFGMVTAKIDQLLIAKLLSTSQLGLFAVANSIITGLVGIFANTFNQATLPALSRESSKSSVIKLTGLALFGSILLSLLVFMFAPLVITFGFGSDYTPSIQLAQIMGFSLVFLFFNRLFEQVLLVKHKEWLYLLENLLGALITIGLNILLISSHGISGAAWAKLISQIILSVILSLIVFGLNYFHGKNKTLVR